MTSTNSSSKSFRYVASDIPEGQTLTEWRRNRNAARRAARRTRRSFHLPRLRPGW